MVLNQNSIRTFLSFWKKEWLIDSGPNLVAETLSRLLLSYQTGYRMQNNTILWLSTFSVEHGVPPAGGHQILSD